MSTVIKTPAVTANEDTVLLAEWLVLPGSFVRKGEAICAVETTKANVEVEAECDGYVHPAVVAGERVAVGAPLAVVTDRPDENAMALLDAAGGIKPVEKRWTKKAAITARRLGVDIAALAEKHPGKLLSEDDVIASQAPAPSAACPNAVTPAGEDLLWHRFPQGRPERILLLGGGAGAGIVALDSLSRLTHQRAVGILDKNPATHGKTVANVPVLGGLERAEELWRAGVCDSVIILFSDSLIEREELFNRLRAKGVPFANLVDPSAQLRSHVRMGQGNLILGNGFLAACVTLGDNNFITSHACIEHHSRVGSHCAFGPRLTTTGYVKIGDRVRTGMAVSLEPHVKIGSDSVIASGCVLTSDVPPRSSVKAQQSHIVRPLQTEAAE